MFQFSLYYGRRTIDELESTDKHSGTLSEAAGRRKLGMWLKSDISINVHSGSEAATLAPAFWSTTTAASAIPSTSGRLLNVVLWVHARWGEQDLGPRILSNDVIRTHFSTTWINSTESVTSIGHARCRWGSEQRIDTPILRGPRVQAGSEVDCLSTNAFYNQRPPICSLPIELPDSRQRILLFLENESNNY